MSNWKFLFIVYGILALVAIAWHHVSHDYYTEGYETGVRACWEEVENKNDGWWVATVRKRMTKREINNED